MVGKTLGHYEVLEPLGAGGMGEVYRARDTKLDRDVAIKVLPEDFATDAGRLARFEREAKLLASLSHANIAAIYGLEDEGDVHFIAMELVEGETLAERIARSGRIDVDEALEIARQIAEALEAAHASGVIHRDLKPANVIVTVDGKTKVLDFGLAKASISDGDACDSLTHSPTATVVGTEAGVLLGTAPYMSPEQAKGKVIDKRTDIWAWGCVVFEMLTGKRPFQGENVTETLAAVLKEEPDLDLLPGEIPHQAASLLQRCLRKDPSRRLRDIGDARIEIEDINLAESRTRSDSSGIHAPRRWAERRAMIALLGAISLAAAAGLAVWAAMRPEAETPQRVTVVLPDEHVLARRTMAIARAQPVAISPDGKMIVYTAVAGDEDQSRLWRRSLDQFDPEPIPGTQGARDPFFSPDGNWIGFVVGETIRRMPSYGGISTEVCEVEGFFWSATWADDDTILFATADGVLHGVPARGGAPEVIAKPDDLDRHGQLNQPEALPGSHRALAVAWRGEVETSTLVLVDLETKAVTDLGITGVRPRFVPRGYVLYANVESVWALPFNPRTLETDNDPTPLAADVQLGVLGTAQFDVSDTGTLVFLPRSGTRSDRTVVWVDRQGRSTPITESPGAYGTPRLSPDGNRLAFGLETEEGWQIWIRDLRTSTNTQIAAGETAQHPIWSPDGLWLSYRSGDPGGSADLYVVRTDFTAPAALLLDNERSLGTSGPNGWSKQGLLLHQQRNPDTGERAGFALNVADVDDLTQFTGPEETYYGGSLSPDGNWVVYDASVASNPLEIYVRPFPGGGERFTVSVDGGNDPVWSRDGSEIYYWRGQDIMVAEVSIDGTFRHGPPERLFSGPFWNGNGTHIDVGLTKDRLLLVQTSDVGPAVERINIILNWFEELKRLVPTER